MECPACNGTGNPAQRQRPGDVCGALACPRCQGAGEIASGILYRTDGTQESLVPHDGVSYHLEELVKMVGGFIEVQKLLDGRWMVMHEEGLRMRLPINEVATVMAYHLEGPILGDVLVCDHDLIQ